MTPDNLKDVMIASIKERKSIRFIDKLTKDEVDLCINDKSENPIGIVIIKTKSDPNLLRELGMNGIVAYDNVTDDVVNTVIEKLRHDDSDKRGGKINIKLYQNLTIM